MQSIAAVQNAFRARFSDRNPPMKRTVMKNVSKYSDAGTSLNLNKGNSGRRRTTCSEENITAVRDLLQQNSGNMSARRNPLLISRTCRLQPSSIYAGTRTECMCDTSCWQPTFHVDYASQSILQPTVDERCRRRRSMQLFQ